MNSTSNVGPNGVGTLPFTPLFGINAFFTSVFAVLLLVQLTFTVLFWSFYGYAIGMVCGLLLELLGYVAKVLLSHNREDKNGYIMYIIGLTLGPTFLSSSLYLTIVVLQRHYPESRFAYVSPRLFAGLFILGDFICLCLIGVGGSLAAIYSDKPIGVDLMLGGLSTQVLFTAIFCTLVFIMRRRIGKSADTEARNWFILGTGVAAACLFIRSCWRVAELSKGFNGPLASEEGVFIALDSIPMIVMSILLTILHPKFWLNYI
ncbi:RTA1 like protein-domain-containing protein [Lipomyces kononenkoae]|uniref:RTA1 like protein-domain-containing protein n=1 Tax=Lipomyces kononenkoae TaxID=34357 RepID=A0ACC3SXY0_LIPKO